MTTYYSTIVEHEGQLCIVFPDELCEKRGIKVDDPIDVYYDENQDALIIKFLEKPES